MTETNEKPKSALVHISDLLGLSNAADRLVAAIERGIGNFLAPIQKRRTTNADITAFNDWNKALRNAGLEPTSADLTIEQRAIVRVLADESRKQQNRESIGLAAAVDFNESEIENASEAMSEQVVEPYWIDQFWLLAENITDADMQAVWGRVLSRQLRGTSKFGARTLHVLSTLSREEAHLLERIAAVTSRVSNENKITHFVLSGLHNNTTNPELNDANRRLNGAAGDLHRELFGPAGIYLDAGGTSWAFGITVKVEKGITPLSIGNRLYELHFPDDGENRLAYLGSGIGFSPTGSEIVSLINCQPNADYLAALLACCEAHGFKLKGR